MMSVSGSERCTTETSSVSSSAGSGLPSAIRRVAPSFTRLRRRGVADSAVSAERAFTRKSVDDALMTLAIIRTTPGAVSCRLMVVMSASSGTKSSAAVNTSVTQFSISRPSATSRRRAGNIVTFIVTVA